MTTSGVTTFTMTRDQIITAALQKVGQLQWGDTPSADQLTAGALALNEVVKNWQALGVRLWTVEWVTMPITAASVVLGTDGLDYTCIRSHTSASGNEPVTGADYTTCWKQTGTGGVAWLVGTAYSAAGDFSVDADTLSIEKAFLRRNGYQDLPISLIGRDQYADVPDKTVAGRPTFLFFDARLSQHVFLWPQPDDTTDVLHVYRVRALEDFVDPANNPDMPQKWIRPLIYALATDLGDEAQLDPGKQDRLERKAELLFAKVKAGDYEQNDDSFVRSAY